MSNQFGDALDAQDENETSQEDISSGDDEALEAFLNRANADGEKNHTIGVGVTKEMHYLYRELRASDDVDIDIPQSIRDQIERFARRHSQVANRARQKYEIDHE